MVNLITLGAIAVGAFTSLWLFVMWVSQPETVKLSTATVGGAILFLGLACYALSRSGQVTMAAWVAVLAAVAIAAYSVVVRGVTSVNVIIFAPTVAAGGTAPVTLAGAMVQGQAEMMAALLLVQLKREGAPFICSTSCPIPMDKLANALEIKYRSKNVGCSTHRYNSNPLCTIPVQLIILP